MSALRFAPSVFVIGDEYEVLLCLTDPALVSLSVGGETYYEENSGALPSERTVARIRLPQAALDAARGYEVVTRKTIKRKAYFSEFEDEVREAFAFAPVPAEGDVNIYYIADVHYRFAAAEQTVSYFGDKLHLLIANGDLGEVETEENYLEVCEFLANAAGGCVPIVMARGNHDTRGRLAERFTDYFPGNGKKTYYAFHLAALSGVVLDCGEDKPDNHKEYGGNYNGAAVYNGSNAFEPFRRQETQFLRSLTLPEGRPHIAISHICPSMTAKEAGSIFDIERDVYTAWNEELARIGIDVMLTGHLHQTFVLEREDARALLPNPYPVIVGARPTKAMLIRDESGLFTEVRQKGSIGIPTIVREDGSICLDWTEFGK